MDGSHEESVFISILHPRFAVCVQCDWHGPPRMHLMKAYEDAQRHLRVQKK